LEFEAKRKLILACLDLTCQPSIVKLAAG